MRSLIGIAAIGIPLFAAAPVRLFDVAVPMRDGVRLSANVFRPSAPARYPTVLLRTPYGKGAELTANFQSFVEHGYAVVVQDVRGRNGSGGEFEPINQEVNDGRRHAELDCRAALVGRQRRNVRRLLSGHCAVESGHVEEPPPEGHLPLRCRR